MCAMAQSSTQDVSNNRKIAGENHVSSKKKPSFPTPAGTLIQPHEAVLAELSTKYDILHASVISSSKIRQRTASATEHLLAPNETKKPHLVLLHARVECISKLITIVETAKRVLDQEGKAWWQYNQLYEQSEKLQKAKDVVEETRLEGVHANESDGDEEEFFETMGARLEQAIRPEPKSRPVKSLRIFLATGPVAELRTKSNVTVQTSSDRP
ncbi:hypothetical protein CC79DRAFT_1373084 [Sarocladium strictum]